MTFLTNNWKYIKSVGGGIMNTVGENKFALKKISIGNQGFDDIRKNDCFYIDKTAFIKE